MTTSWTAWSRAGLRELLEFLQERNVRMAVNTNRKNPGKVLERLR